MSPLAIANALITYWRGSVNANGNATDWHLIHLGQLALSGAGLLILVGGSAVLTNAGNNFDNGCVQFRRLIGNEEAKQSCDNCGN